MARERRAHQRRDLDTHAALVDDEGTLLTSARAINVSDGGVLVTLPDCETPDVGAWLNVRFAVPRSTPSTYMLEAVRARGRVVWNAPPAEDQPPRAAVEFEHPLSLLL